MVPDTVFDEQATTGSGGNGGPLAGEVEAWPRVDLNRVLTGLRHLSAATEPARVFTDLAAVCVPALCDECLIEITEQGGRRYRIRGPGLAAGRSWHDLSGRPVDGPAGDGLAAAVEQFEWSGNGAEVRTSGGSVVARFGSPPGGGPAYTGGLVCQWHHGYVPTEADAVLVGVLVDHATALVHRERITARVSDLDAARQVGWALDGRQRIAAATGVLMALYHLSPAQARQLLARAGDRAHRSLRDVADSVLHTGALPDQRDRPVGQGAASGSVWRVGHRETCCPD